jgi:hypothetical protein
LVQQTFRARTGWTTREARYRKIHAPLGPARDHLRRQGDQPQEQQPEEGVPRSGTRTSPTATSDSWSATTRRKKQKKLYPVLEVEFTSQPTYSYSFPVWEFRGEDGMPPLELAYALTVHKTQGSEFGVDLRRAAESLLAAVARVAVHGAHAAAARASSSSTKGTSGTLRRYSRRDALGHRAPADQPVREEAEADPLRG